MTQYVGHKEMPDQTPLELPLGYEHPQTLEEKIAQCINQNEFNKLNNELETYEEADDFEIDEEEGEIKSQYEFKDMEDEPVYRRKDSEEDKPEETKTPDPPEKVGSETENAQ